MCPHIMAARNGVTGEAWVAPLFMEIFVFVNFELPRTLTKLYSRDIPVNSWPSPDELPVALHIYIATLCIFKVGHSYIVSKDLKRAAVCGYCFQVCSNFMYVLDLSSKQLFNRGTPTTNREPTAVPVFWPPGLLINKFI